MDQPIRVLLVEDDPDDYVLTRGLLSDVGGSSFEIEWVQTYAQGLEALRDPAYDVVLLDYRLGQETGVQFLEHMPSEGDAPPIILLTGQGDRETDVAAMRAGAADYLSKEGLSGVMLERSMRYAIERRRAEEARQEAELRYRMLVESVGAVVWQADPETFEFSLVSREAEALLGYPVERWIEDPHFWADHIHPEDRAWVVERCRQATQRREPHSFEYRMIAADGRVVWLCDVVRVLEAYGRRELVGVMVDITERKQNDLRLAAERRILEAISQGEPLEDVLDLLVRTVEERAPGIRCSVLLLEGTRLRHAAAPSLPEDYTRAVDGLEIGPAAGSCGTAAFEGRSIVARDIATDPRWADWREVALSHGLKAGWSQPILSGDGAVLGTFAGYYSEPRSPDTDAVRIVAQAVRLAAIAIERIRSHEMLRLRDRALEAISEGILVTDPSQDDNPIIYANPAFERLTGYAPGEVLGRNCRFLQGEETAADAVDALRTAIQSGQPVTTELLNYRKDGSPFWNRLSISPVRDEAGQPSLFVGVQQNVTEQRQSAQALAEAEAHYRRLLETSPYPIYALDEQARFVELNPAARNLLGYPSSLLGHPFQEVLAPEDVPRAVESFREIMVGIAEGSDLEITIVTASGERRLVHVRSTAVRVDGHVVGVHGVARDITDERARDQRRRMLEAALEGLPQGISITSEEGELLYANTAHAGLLGVGSEGSQAYAVESFLPDDVARKQLHEIRQNVQEHGSWSGRIWRRRRDNGQVVPRDLVVGRVTSPGGRTLALNVLTDATDEIEREQQLRRVERLASVGTLVSGVAHELNNPLASILNFTQLLLAEERPEEEREDLQTIHREAERMAKIVADLQQFARNTQEKPQRASIDLNEVVRHVLKVRGYSLRTSDVEVREDLSESLPDIWADRGQIEQVVLNLVVNAEHAMMSRPVDRRLIVRTRASASGVSLHVVDNGPGIPPEHLARIYDPFWTTKEPGQGTGLGLSLVHSIIAEHDGEIRVDSEVGTGTAFRLELPRAEPEASRSSAAATDERQPDSLRVLIVDDEPALRRSMLRYFSRRGHVVDEAAEGREALRLLEENDYDVVLSDLRMPGLDGMALLKELDHRGLADRVVFITGDVEGSGSPLDLATHNVPVLRKPIALEQVARVLEQRHQA